VVETADYFTVKNLRKTLADNSRKKVQNYLRATHSDISNINLNTIKGCEKRPLFSIIKANVFFVDESI